MKNHLLLLIGVIMLLSCELDEANIDSSPSLKLRFSQDTVIFDTVLTDRTSLTKRFRIFNPNRQAINISEIRLGLGRFSDYSLIINGRESRNHRLEDEVLLGGDSLLVLVNVDIDPQDINNPYIVKDSVVVNWNGNSEHVKLVAWGQDAIFLNSATICDETWTADRPYVIYNLALVDTLCSLTVEPGARIFIDNNASLFVKGSLKILGDSGNHVTIRNTRFDENYREAPGQWGGIFYLEGTYDNEVRYADIENGIYGLRIGNPDDDTDIDLTVSHSSIRHMAVSGILSFSSDVYAYNTEIYNIGSFMVGGLAGGNYRFEHCTFTNSPSFFRDDSESVVFADNLAISERELLVSDLSVEMTNCIVWGRGERQLLISNEGGAAMDTSFSANIIRYDQAIPGNLTSTKNNYPGFANPSSFDFSLDSLAFARNQGKPIGIADDITGRLRDDQPDIGAYERIDNQ